jgi:hypothetical protein
MALSIALVPFALIVAAAIAMSLTFTLRSYCALPADVPDHFDGYGWPDAFGPRPVIFAVIVAEAIAVAIWAALLRQWFIENDPVRFVVASGFAASGLLWTLAWMQKKILRVATTKAERMDKPYEPLLVLLAGIVLAVLSGPIMK